MVRYNFDEGCHGAWCLICQESFSVSSASYQVIVAKSSEGTTPASATCNNRAVSKPASCLRPISVFKRTPGYVRLVLSQSERPEEPPSRRHRRERWDRCGFAYQGVEGLRCGGEWQLRRALIINRGKVGALSVPYGHASSWPPSSGFFLNAPVAGVPSPHERPRNAPTNRRLVPPIDEASQHAPHPDKAWNRPVTRPHVTSTTIGSICSGARQGWRSGRSTECQ